jgi:hypothetical protein
MTDDYRWDDGEWNGILTPEDLERFAIGHDLAALMRQTADSMRHGDRLEHRRELDRKRRDKAKVHSENEHNAGEHPPGKL